VVVAFGFSMKGQSIPSFLNPTSFRLALPSSAVKKTIFLRQVILIQKWVKNYSLTLKKKMRTQTLCRWHRYNSVAASLYGRRRRCRRNRREPPSAAIVA